MKAQILLVEDNPDDELLLLRALHKVDSEIAASVAHDGQECIDLLSEADNPGNLPAVVLLDLKLPRLDGFAVLRQIRERLQLDALPVLVLSSSDEEKDLVRSYESGASGYVRKPDSFEDLVEAVHAVVVYWIRTNRVPTR